MAVRCEGDRWIMEQVGERQDFECELTRLGLKHEDFELHVRRASLASANKAWSSNYAVRVSHKTAGRHNIYWGGPGQDWVAQFAADVAGGLYGRLLPVRSPAPPANAREWPRRSRP